RPSRRRLLRRRQRLLGEGELLPELAARRDPAAGPLPQHGVWRPLVLTPRPAALRGRLSAHPQAHRRLVSVRVHDRELLLAAPAPKARLCGLLEAVHASVNLFPLRASREKTVLAWPAFGLDPP